MGTLYSSLPFAPSSAASHMPRISPAEKMHTAVIASHASGPKPRQRQPSALISAIICAVISLMCRHPSRLGLRVGQLGKLTNSLLVHFEAVGGLDPDELELPGVLRVHVGEQAVRVRQRPVLRLIDVVAVMLTVVGLG